MSYYHMLVRYASCKYVTWFVNMSLTNVKKNQDDPFVWKYIIYFLLNGILMIFFINYLTFQMISNLTSQGLFKCGNVSNNCTKKTS